MRMHLPYTMGMQIDCQYVRIMLQFAKCHSDTLHKFILCVETLEICINGFKYENRVILYIRSVCVCVSCVRVICKCIV